MIAGQGVYICDECINLCQEIIEEELLETPRPKSASTTLPNPRQIKDSLDQYVISQERANRVEQDEAEAVNVGRVDDVPAPVAAGAPCRTPRRQRQQRQSGSDHQPGRGPRRQRNQQAHPDDEARSEHCGRSYSADRRRAS